MKDGSMKDSFRRRMAIHEDVPSWKPTTEEVKKLRTHWRRQSSSYFLFDDWGGSLADLQPNQEASRGKKEIGEAAPSSMRMGLLRRASARDRIHRSVSPSPIRKFVSASARSSTKYKKLEKLEEPLHGSGSLHVDEDDLLHEEEGDHAAAVPDVKKRGMPTTTSTKEVTTPEDDPESQWIVYAVGVMVLGVGSSVPFNQMLATDPGSPLFIAFVTHIFLVVCNLQKVLPALIQKGGQSTLPMTYHAACVLLGYSFNVLRADAFVRLPPAVAMILMNCRMMVGMTFDFFALGTRYSYPQVVSAGVVTVGILWSGISTSAAKAAASSATSIIEEEEGPSTVSMMIGAAELLLGMTLITLLTTTVKIGYQRYGECPEEQVFFQHLFALPMFYLVGSQWQQIGPRLEQWVADKDWSKGLLLLSNLMLTFGHTHSLALFTARAPNMLLYQIVDTVKKFSIVVVTALGRAPPFPPTGFWGGSLVLVAGTLQFLSVSQPPKEEDDDEDEMSQSSEEGEIESKKEK